MSTPIKLRDYNNDWYRPGRSTAWRIGWIMIGSPIFRSSILPFSRLRVALLRLFGAQIGNGVVLHSEITVKYPWHLTIGDDAWIGERAWIDNLTTVHIGSNACISQGAYLCTGNHDWTSPTFNLRIAPIFLGDGSWVAAMSTLLPGATLGECAIAAAGSVVSGEIPPYEIFAGNPAVFVRERNVEGSRTEQHEWQEVAL
ncbi:WcaF family extracellular polysaccharide biosynthesis acetyltransferase [Silvibacterium sp.]|uniref:WcaF family extracellular polysaccharide biosynthesis acetyltransferase n=1 Tax=Silvibacterium sp. TaxID=1964179 RepID=UPI0039E3E60F